MSNTPTISGRQSYVRHIQAPLARVSDGGGWTQRQPRTFGSALPAHLWTGLWIHFIAPPLAMPLAAELYLRVKTVDQVIRDTARGPTFAAQYSSERHLALANSIGRR